MKTFDVSILWGESPKPDQSAETYSFDTQAELDAFLLGVAEMDGWAGYEIVKPVYVPGDSNDSQLELL